MTTRQRYRKPGLSFLNRIDELVVAAEQTAFTWPRVTRNDNYLSGVVYQTGPLAPVYERTPAEPLALLIHWLGLAYSTHWASFGSGLGADAFVAAWYFEGVTGFEVDSSLCLEAERIRDELCLTNVRFVQRDFLTLSDAELAEFGGIYVYRPFMEDFEAKLGVFLRRTRTGTVVVSRGYGGDRLFPPGLFLPMTCDEEGGEFGSAFHIYRRA